MKAIIILKWKDFSKDNYETLRKSVNWEGNVPKGLLFHVSGFDNDSLRVTDIWESAEDFNNFVQNRLMPACDAAGIKSEPQVEVVPCHAIHVPAPELIN
jgi:hypothetical protein